MVWLLFSYNNSNTFHTWIQNLKILSILKLQPAVLWHTRVILYHCSIVWSLFHSPWPGPTRFKFFTWSAISLIHLTDLFRQHLSTKSASCDVNKVFPRSHWVTSIIAIHSQGHNQIKASLIPRVLKGSLHGYETRWRYTFTKTVTPVTNISIVLMWVTTLCKIRLGNQRTRPFNLHASGWPAIKVRCPENSYEATEFLVIITSSHSAKRIIMPLHSKPYSCFDIPTLRYGDSHSGPSRKFLKSLRLLMKLLLNPNATRSFSVSSLTLQIRGRSMKTRHGCMSLYTEPTHH